VAWSAPSKLEYRDWVVEGRRIGLMSRGSQWWVGDWLLYGTGRWGEMYVQAAKVTGYDPKSLRNYRYVASRIDVSLRKDNLTFGHHALLASLEPDAQRHWLERAVHDRLSVEDLRGELRAERRGELEESDELPPFSTSCGVGARGTTVVICPNCGDRVPIPAGALRPRECCTKLT
jgi:hypothetical protein